MPTTNLAITPTTLRRNRHHAQLTAQHKQPAQPTCHPPPTPRHRVSLPRRTEIPLSKTEQQQVRIKINKQARQLRHTRSRGRRTGRRLANSGQARRRLPSRTGPPVARIRHLLAADHRPTSMTLFAMPGRNRSVHPPTPPAPGPRPTGGYPLRRWPSRDRPSPAGGCAGSPRVPGRLRGGPGKPNRTK